MKSLKSNISEAYKVQVDCLKNSDPDLYEKNNMREKKKAASYLEQIQIFTLVPGKWSRIYCSEYFNVFEYLVWASHEIKKAVWILGKPAP